MHLSLSPSLSLSLSLYLYLCVGATLPCFGKQNEQSAHALKKHCCVPWRFSSLPVCCPCHRKAAAFGIVADFALGTAHAQELVSSDVYLKCLETMTRAASVGSSSPVQVHALHCIAATFTRLGEVRRSTPPQSMQGEGADMAGGRIQRARKKERCEVCGVQCPREKAWREISTNCPTPFHAHTHTHTRTHKAHTQSTHKAHTHKAHTKHTHARARTHTHTHTQSTHTHTHARTHARTTNMIPIAWLLGGVHFVGGVACCVSICEWSRL